MRRIGLGYILQKHSISIPCLTGMIARFAFWLVSASSFVLLLAPPAAAQIWWPQGQELNDRPPRPQGRVYQPQPPPGGAMRPPGAPAGYAQQGSAPPICIQLEQRLAEESNRGADNRTVLPAIQEDIRRVEADASHAEQQIERGDCYEYFLFVKSLRNTRQCRDLASQRDAARSRAAELKTQLQQMMASSGRSYRDDIVRELARNNCGANYQQQARNADRSGGNFWDEGESSSGGGAGFGSLGYATYRTICVRLCDGYYFPVSFSTLPNHFERDAEVCQSKCAAPAELYYHQNPGAGVDQATSVSTNELYSKLKVAFRYRKEYVAGCSCKMAEFIPDPSAPPRPQQTGVMTAPNGAAASGWSSEEPQQGSTSQVPGALRQGQYGAGQAGQTGQYDTPAQSPDRASPPPHPGELPWARP